MGSVGALTCPASVGVVDKPPLEAGLNSGYKAHDGQLCPQKEGHKCAFSSARRPKTPAIAQGTTCGGQVDFGYLLYFPLDYHRILERRCYTSCPSSPPDMHGRVTRKRLPFPIIPKLFWAQNSFFLKTPAPLLLSLLAALGLSIFLHREERGSFSPGTAT